MTRRPMGYFYLALFIGAESLAAVPFALYKHGPWYARASLMLVIALAGVSVEALWKVRPWCTRAVAALSLSVLVFGMAMTEFRRGLADAGALLGVAAVMALVVAYVHDREVKLFGRRAPRVRSPRAAAGRP